MLSDDSSMLEVFGGQNMVSPRAENWGFLISITVLDGLNYLEWSKSVKLYVGSRGKLEYLSGDIPQPKEAGAAHDKWVQDNYLIMFWLVASIHPSLRNNFMWAETVKEIWDQAKATFFEQRHYARIYQLQVESSNCK